MGREQEVTVIPEPKLRRSIFGRRFVFLISVTLVILLLYYAFSEDGGPLSGKAIKNSKTYDFNAELGPLKSQIEVNQEIKEIALNLKRSAGKIYLGGNILDLSGLNSPDVKISNFDGRLIFDGGMISRLEGKIEKITVNKVPSLSSTGQVKITLDKPIPYNELTVKGIYIDEYSSVESGTAEFNSGKITIDLSKDNILLGGFSGTFSSGNIGEFGIKKQGLKLDGSVHSASIGENFQIG